MYRITSIGKSICTMLMMLFLAGYVHAQQPNKIQLKRSHALSPSNARDVIPATGSIDIVGIIVEFQPDTNRFTTGTGTFDEGSLPFLESRPDFRIDPLPHNQNYFEAHLEFVKNYFERVSRTQLQVNYQVIPTIFRLDNEMAAYSPTGEEFNPGPIADFVTDVWAKVEEEGAFNTAGLDPDRTAFVIFHAGVGRDIELTGTLLTRTPQDIPSLSLRQGDLAEFLEEPGFQGFPINGGSFLVKNSLIIPRTETRPGEGIGGEELVIPLSINGLLTASIGSFLGLPDLFNTNDGRPGIGRFGLMDGASFFSYNGLFPPAPSAWEKIFLGWDTPFEVDVNDTNPIQLPAASLDLPGSIARVSITQDEYFLIENRHRDSNDNGVILTTLDQSTGNTSQRTFTNLDEAFTFQEADFDTLLDAGVLINVSDFDWSLPGGLDRGEDGEIGGGDDRFLNGGMLIWHIDETVIRSTLVDQEVNANPERRGVDLEEADGAQDIGRPTSLLLSNDEEFGTPFDFWWSGNNSRVELAGGTVVLFPGEFSPESSPTNNSNSGALSFFRLFNFSDNLPTASFRIEPYTQDDQIYRVGIDKEIGVDGFSTFETENDYQFYTYFPLGLDVFETPTDTFLVIPSTNGTYVDQFSSNSQPIQIDANVPRQPYTGQFLIIGDRPNFEEDLKPIIAYSWDGGAGIFNIEWINTVDNVGQLLSSQNDTDLALDHSTNRYQISTGAPLVTTTINIQLSEAISINFSRTQLSGDFEFFGDREFTLPGSQNDFRSYTGIIQSNQGSQFYTFENDRFSLVIDGEQQTIFEEPAAEWPAITDNFEIFHINRENNELIGYNRNGAVLDFTPIPAPQGHTFIGTPLIADIDPNSEGNEFLVMTKDSLSMNMYGYASNGERLAGFPLLIGSVLNENAQPIHPIIYGNQLFAVSENGTLRSWVFPDMANIEWGSRYGNNSFNKVSARIQDDSANNQPNFSVLNSDETYNWPNPFQDETNIRFQLESPGDIDITIITQSGRLLFERNVQSNGGFAEEIQINTAGWESGVYFAQIEANVDGRTESKLIKMVVLR